MRMKYAFCHELSINVFIIFFKIINNIQISTQLKAFGNQNSNSPTSMKNHGFSLNFHPIFVPETEILYAENFHYS